jgi:hypothetical protein
MIKKRKKNDFWSTDSVKHKQEMIKYIYDRRGNIPIFDGEGKNFASWWRNFLRMQRMSKFKDIFKAIRDWNLPEEEMSEDNNEIKTEIRVAIGKNELAMARFSMVFTTDKVISMVYAASAEGWPEGEAYLVVRQLIKKYRPLDKVLKIEMRQQSARIKMKNSTDPSILFEQLT